MSKEICISAREARALKTLYLEPTLTVVEEGEMKLRGLEEKARALSRKLDDAVKLRDFQAELQTQFRECQGILERLP